jgi:hypothetical protein
MLLQVLFGMPVIHGHQTALKQELKHQDQTLALNHTNAWNPKLT